ncbi:uncharacterized protein BO97DRAFT_419862 [Aspergillus homomorphus CBS 101889]|uniref:Uncharacterized protein n=1 Tax=Aspergillus homomorphus (strain CBS 101889) TaxID=1450537 RepID=A0A395ICA2_ASPHC|nr:hypothetical protein BO97DRAFT_419862 [Aspergillus homomorphus CBS 101889]RAL17625.1 hypothetical protein BO97DRAFT_419862 [Aspergillus homomorphus CBS 101889]
MDSARQGSREARPTDSVDLNRRDGHASPAVCGRSRPPNHRHQQPRGSSRPRAPLSSHPEPKSVINFTSPDAQKQVIESAGGGGLAGVLFSASDIVLKELIIRGNLVANQRLALDMMRFVAEKGVKSHITTLKLEEGKDLPQRYMFPHLKGRLVVVM